MNTTIITNTFIAYSGLVIVLGVATIIAMLPPKILQVSVRESIIAVIGEQGLDEAKKAMRAARSKTDITIPQKRLLQAFGVLIGIPVAVMLLFVTTPLYALSAGGLIAVLGLLYPQATWKGVVRKEVAQGVWNDVPDLVSFLRLNVGEGLGVKEVLDAYVADSPPDAMLANELRQVLSLSEGGANLFDQLELTASRFEDNSLLQVAVALRQVEEADDPQGVLKSLYELIRSVRVAERKKQIKGRVMTSIVLGVVFLLPSLMALVLVPAMVTFSKQMGMGG